MLAFHRFTTSPIAATTATTTAATLLRRNNAIIARHRFGNSHASRTVKSSSKSTTNSTTTTITKPSSPGVNRITSFPKDHPFAFQMIVATVKTSGADIVCQTVAEGKSFSEIDWRRNGIFVVFGFAYLGGFQWYIMVNKYRQWFPTMDRFAKLSMAEKMKDTAGILDAAKMVLFDVIVHLPMMYFPTYYTVKEFVGGSSWNPLDWVTDGCTKYYHNMSEDLSAMIKLWGPSDCIQFVLPLHIRMPFRHLVSFFWTAYVSFTRGSYKDDDEGEGVEELKVETASS